MEISCGISEGKKRDAPSKDFWTHCTVGTGVVKRWRGEDVGRHLCLTSQLRQVSTAIFLLNIRKKIRRWENGTLNNFKLQEFGLTLIERKYAALFHFRYETQNQFLWSQLTLNISKLKGFSLNLFMFLNVGWKDHLIGIKVDNLWSWKWKRIVVYHWNEYYKY